MKKALTKKKKLEKDWKKRTGRRVPKTPLERQSILNRIREHEKVKPSTDRQVIQENNRYSKWKPIEDIKRSFWIWNGRFSFSPKESEIAAILKEHNLRFYREVSFDINKRFDFYIPLIDLVIEYDGSQHFRSLKEIQNDINKEAILKKHGIKYIRYNKTHKLKSQIAHDLIYHPVIVNSNGG